MLINKHSKRQLDAHFLRFPPPHRLFNIVLIYVPFLAGPFSKTFSSSQKSCFGENPRPK